jgi:uncharacterized coiled-coil protein SlyX
VGTVEERVAFLEGRLGEQAIMIDGIRRAIGSLENRLDARLNGVDQRLVALEARVDQRFTAVDQRFTAVDQRFTDLEAGLKHSFTALDEKMSRQFQWVVGIQVTILLAITATTLSAFFALR